MEQKEKQKNSGQIPTRVLSGLMELLPAEQLVFDRMRSVIEEVYRIYGFIALDTPVIERADVLLAKAGGETEQQIYRFTKGENDLALRFDLTVPLARYVSEHANELTFPFRRSHIGKVYRGERPQKGRYREFYQCDIDIIGDGALSLMNDAEIPSVINEVFTRLNFGPFVIRISNRKLVTGLLESLEAGNQSVGIIQTIDKLEKIGENEVRGLLVALGVPDNTIRAIFDFIAISGSSEDMLAALRNLGVDNETFRKGVEELAEVIRHLGVLGVPADNYAIDLTIARGLDYYTGTVYETVLRDHPELGSICSGGRYDNLAEKYTDRKLPGVGISIGLTRLFSQLKEIGLLQFGMATPTNVLVVPLVADISVPLEIAMALREAGLPTEVYFEDVKMKNKLAYANKLGIPFVVLVGEDEIASGEFTVKNMQTGEQIACAKGDIATAVKKEIR
ncbi:histidine--tRNA ligase [Candidatus Wolfebacteria bacterium RIFOXYD12_FULL_48_21]|uniref:Histidine--tRNA ligase n=1 Tax=Candidatus Wolfebacteria bacterium RIFOXYD1_FULL_48_65 TaxID=1802561 RepID=A0A1F8E5G5_9BACT|nr:MAG: histidine--tRNA ligase [Candidatus Wolfebacteria bacterium RIFOXYD12_FULL_48_21]OGM95438.1 MAG: histidine--tRNA ligase [Candidatus Wolfebacteria bacterium RIFOXYD1_FULL_48_65]